MGPTNQSHTPRGVPLYNTQDLSQRRAEASYLSYQSIEKIKLILPFHYDIADRCSSSLIFAGLVLLEHLVPRLLEEMTMEIFPIIQCLPWNVDKLMAQDKVLLFEGD